MKYGETLHQRAPPGWEAYNVDYNEIKNLIKERTTPVRSAAIAIPGAASSHGATKSFEDELYEELANQHLRIDLFVRSKTGEVQRRLAHLEKIALHLQNHPQVAGRTKISVRRLEKFSKLETEIIKAGDQIQALARYVGAQQLAFKKLLKKYRKWTRSTTLDARFEKHVAAKSRTFEKQELEPILLQYTELLAAVRAPFEAGVSWHASEEQPSGDHPSPPGLRTASELHLIFEGGTNLEADAALAALPFGAQAGRASYWVHPENLLQLHVLLLQYSRLKAGNCVTSSPHGVASPTRSPRETLNAIVDPGLGGHEANGIIVCDDLASFAHGRSGITIDQLEAGPGHRAEDAAASIRYADSGECLVLVYPSGDHDRDARDCVSMPTQFKPTTLQPLFEATKQAPAERRRSDARATTSFLGEDPQRVRNWLQEQPTVQPLAHIRYRRSRFMGLGNNQQQGVWITLDSSVHLKKSSLEDLEVPDSSAEFETFPFAVLEIRWESHGVPELVHVLNQSHLVERVPGFSLEVHAVASLYQHPDMPQPHWLSALGRDIRKIPSNGPKKNRRRVSPITTETDTNSPSTAATSTGDMTSSGTRSKDATDSPATSAPEKSDIPVLKMPERKRRFKKPRPKYPGPIDAGAAKRYWNEFDDGDETPTHEAYTVLVDPNAPTPLMDGLTSLRNQGAAAFTQIRALFLPKRDGERQPLLPTDYFSIPAGNQTPTSDESDTSAATRHRPRLTSRLSAFPSYHSLTSPLDPLSTLTAERHDRLLARYAVVAFLAAFLLLVTAGAGSFVWPKGGSVGVDFTVVFAMALSVACVIAGVVLAAARAEDAGWMGKAQVVLICALLCVGNGVLLVYVVAG